jgi:drug/metabolite transporter (DMT)-like permease
MRTLGIILIVVGVLAVALPYIPFTQREKVLDIGPIEAVKEEKKTLPISPIVGVVAVAGGAALVIAGAVRNKS